MCGIVGATAQRDVRQILVEGLRRLEYRGYDSAGLALVDATGVLRGGNTVVFRIGSDALGTAQAMMRLALDPALAAAGLPAGASARPFDRTASSCRV